MSDARQETVENVIASLDEFASRHWMHVEGRVVCDFVGRLRAARRREKSEIEADALAVGGIVEAARHKPGNAAAMREALIKALTLLQVCDWPPGVSLDGVGEVIREIDSVLDKPPRNCDVGTAEEQIERLYGGETCPSCKSPQMTSDGCACVREGTCALRWAQMPYEAKEKGDCDGE